MKSNYQKLIEATETPKLDELNLILGKYINSPKTTREDYRALGCEIWGAINFYRNKREFALGLYNKRVK